MQAPQSSPKHLPKAPPSNTIILGGRISHINLGDGVHIQSITHTSIQVLASKIRFKITVEKIKLQKKSDLMKPSPPP